MQTDTLFSPSTEEPIDSLSSTATEEEPRDSLVRLVSAESAQIVELDGISYRKVFGPATFEHNNTFLICDTALWNVNTNVIDAFGNVKIVQDQTELTSDKMFYYVDEDLAEFRGSLVQLQDKDNNTLRTRHLDYNTKDSIAIFANGAAMRDQDGQVIESESGTYEAKKKAFFFADNVNMFTDSIFVKTSTLLYESDKNKANFGTSTNVWKDDNMLSAEAGWYERNEETFLFYNDVHVMSPSQEGWSDSLYFYRNQMIIKMYGDAQVTDTTKNVSALAGKIYYIDSLSRITLTRDPSIILLAKDEETQKNDTVFFGADTLIYHTQMMCDIDSVFLAGAKKRKESLAVDPVESYVKKAAADAEKAALDEARKNPNNPLSHQKNKGVGKKPKSKPNQNKSLNQNQSKTQTQSLNKSQNLSMKPKSSSIQDSKFSIQHADSTSVLPDLTTVLTDSTSVLTDSISVLSDSTSVLPDSTSVLPDSTSVLPDLTTVLTDSTSVLTDSTSVLSDSTAVILDSTTVEVAPDTTRMGFLTAIRNVKVFKSDIQTICDSLVYSDVDSLARLYKSPLIWDEITRQYSADSIYVVVKNNALEKANLISNAFVHMMQDSLHHNQIKGAEMMAYFGEGRGLRRFDALGGASALFYIEENGELATVNKKESKMLSALFVDGNISKIHYYEAPKSDAYPVVQLTESDRELKGYNWQDTLRPVTRYDITKKSLRRPERSNYSSVPKAKYPQTDIYFPGYIDDINRQIEYRDSVNIVNERENELRKKKEKELAKFKADSLFTADSLFRVDSLFKVDSLKLVTDSLAKVSADSLKVAKDSIAKAEITKIEKKAKPSWRERRTLARAKRKAKREARIAAQEKRWAELDKLDAEKIKAREEKREKKKREKEMEMYLAAQEQARKDAALLEKYKQKYKIKYKDKLYRYNNIPLDTPPNSASNPN